MLVVLESTITPGRTRMARDPGGRVGLVAGRDCSRACARAGDGRPAAPEHREHDRVVGGIDEYRRPVPWALLARLRRHGHPMTATAAEVTKTAENTFRDLQIAAVNQLALYCEAMGINVYDVGPEWRR